MPSWLVIVLGVFGPLNTLLLALFLVARWSQKVESPVAMELLSRDIQNLTKEIERLSAVFDRRYTGLEGRHNTDHEKLRQMEKDKAVTDSQMADMRRDLDEVRRKCGILHTPTNGATDHA